MNKEMNTAKEIMRFFEYYRCDAIKLTELFGPLYSESEDVAGAYNLSPKIGLSEEDPIKTINVETTDALYRVAYIDSGNPVDEKLRYKNYYRIVIGREIKEKRERTGMSRAEVAFGAGIRPHALERIEQGRWDMDISLLGRILNVLKATIHIE